MRKSKIMALALAAAMVVSLVPADAADAAKKVKLSTKSKKLEVKKTFKLKVKNAKKSAKVSWKSNKKGVAKIKKATKKGNATATILGVKKGTAKITATVKQGKKKTNLKCTVKVIAASNVTPTAAPTVAPTAAPTTVPATPSPTVAPERTFMPSAQYANVSGYYAGFNGSKSARGKDNLYVNYVMVDSKEVNTKANVVNKLKFKIDSSDVVEYGIYVSESNCSASGLGDKGKVGSFKTDGTIGQQVEVEIAGDAISKLAAEMISFGFYSTEDKYKQVYCIYDMHVGYGDKYYPAPLSEATAGCTGSAKGLFETKTKSAAAAIDSKYTPLRDLTAAKGYKFGTCVTVDQIKNDKEFCDLVKTHCDSITATNEFKAYSLLNQSACQASEDGMPTGMNWANADAIAQWAKDNGLKIRGHALVWDQSMCQWFFNEGYANNETDAEGNVTNRVDAETMKARLKSYIEQVITHFETEYPGVIYCWDVVNEGIDAEWDGSTTSTDPLKIRQTRDNEKNPFYEVLGGEYIHLSFLYAKDTLEKLGNTSIDLVYNDYNVIYGGKRTAIINLCKDINKYAKDDAGNNRKLVDTIGMQGYLGYGNQGNCLKDDLVTSVKDAINEMSKAGFKVQLTEMAMRSFVNDAENTAAHAEFSKKIFSALADINTSTNNAFTSMSLWAFIDDPLLNYTTDEYEYDIYTPYSGLFDETLAPKASFEEVYKALGGTL